MREIKKEGSFNDEDHYLDVNFRLLKEDFSRDLREGLANYLYRSKDKNTLINAYENVQVTGFFAAQGFFGLELQIFKEHGKFIKSWSHQ